MSSVALRAGVSMASGSRVLNGMSARFNAKSRVRAAIAELSYQPNSATCALKVRESVRVVLIRFRYGDVSEKRDR
jgi:LacI family transcriptional regulator